MKLEQEYIEGPAGRLALWTTGPVTPELPAVLFVHPINMRGLIWEDLAALLGPRTLLMPDMRAHGESDASGEFGLDAWSADLMAVADHAGIDRFHVIGGSLGGPLACCLAAAEPERVVSLTAVGSSVRIEGVDVTAVLSTFDELGVEGTFRAVFPEITFGPGTPPEMIERGVALANPNDVATVKRVWLAAITSDVTRQARRVTCPSLVVNGEHDQTCPPAGGLALASELRTELVVMPGVGHMPMLEAPERLAALIEVHIGLAERASSSSPTSTASAGGIE